jgi:hypothetical protein
MNKQNMFRANFAVKKLALCLLKPVGLTGVFSVVAETWGTCMFRVSDKADNIEIQHIDNQRCPHTYTVIPAGIYENVFYLYANIRTSEGFCVLLPSGARVVGLHSAIESKGGKWQHYSYLVYSPHGIPPEITPHPAAGAWAMNDDGGEISKLNFETLYPGTGRRYINAKGETCTKLKIG